MTQTTKLPFRLFASSIAALTLVASGCGGGPGVSRANDRWVTTKNTTVDIDWNAIGEAYKDADGPEDLERRVNEIYTGDEIISIAVRDEGANRQVVTGFFDKNANGQAEKAEEIFAIQRDLEDKSKANYQIHGYGPYSGYTSPMWSLASGMLMGAMFSRMFMPSYSPMYTRPYTTPASRRTALVSQRNSYRKANPSKFSRSKNASRSGTKSKSGRSYNRRGSGFRGGRSTPSRSRSRGGGRFGIAAGRARQRIRLS